MLAPHVDALGAAFRGVAGQTKLRLPDSLGRAIVSLSSLAGQLRHGDHREHLPELVELLREKFPSTALWPAYDGAERHAQEDGQPAEAA